MFTKKQLLTLIKALDIFIPSAAPFLEETELKDLEDSREILKEENEHRTSYGGKPSE